MIDSIESIVHGVRNEMTAQYGDNLSGHCIEASEKIVELLSGQLGLDAVTVEGWCRYDDESYGSDHPWDPHTWVEVPSLGLYIDATADQFNYGMDAESQFPDVIIQKGLPYGMQYEEPTWEDYEMNDDAHYMNDNYRNDIEKALNVLSEALDSVSAAEKSGAHFHSEVGTRLAAAKSLISESLQFAVANSEKIQQSDYSAAQEPKVIHSFKDSSEALFIQLSNMLDYKIKYGDEFWEDISVSLPMDNEFYPGFGVVIRCMEDDCRETFFSLSVYENFSDKTSDNEILNVCTETDEFAELKEAFDLLMTQLPQKLSISSHLDEQEPPAESISSSVSQYNTQINYLYRDANNYKVHNSCIVSGEITEDQKSAILSSLDNGVYFIPHLVGMPEVKFDEIDDPAVDHQWFELYEYSFERTTKQATISSTAAALTVDFYKCKGIWNELYLAECFPDKSWSARYGVVGIDDKRSAYTVKEYTSAEEYLKDFSRLTSSFERRNDALREGLRLCRLLKVPFVHPDKKNSLDNLIGSASTRASESHSTAEPALER